MGTVAGEQYKRKKVKEKTGKDGEVRWTSDRQHGNIKKEERGMKRERKEKEKKREIDRVI